MPDHVLENTARHVLNATDAHAKPDAGPGSKGIGDTAIRNYDKWKQIRVNMDTIAENKPVDTSLTLFGRTFKYPGICRSCRCSTASLRRLSG